MPEPVLDLINYLRRAGFAISTGETMDFATAWLRVGLNRADFITAALCTLTKDKTSYHQLPDYIAAYLGDLKAGQTVLPDPIDVTRVLEDPPRLTEDEFRACQQRIQNEIRVALAALQDRFPSGRGAMGQGGTGVVGMGTRGGDARQAAPLAQVPGQQKNSQLVEANGKPGLTNLRELDLAQASAEQLAEIKKMLTGLGRSWAGARGYRQKPWPTGSVDMRRTVARAISHQGVPLVLCRQRRVPGRPRIVLLCDLSGSVAPYSAFMLQLLFGLQQRFRDLRSFAFVDYVAEVTHLAQGSAAGFTVSAQKIIREAKISKTGFSHYGQVWSQFQQDFAHQLRRETTVLVLGDARNNWQPDGLEHFRALVGQCRRLFWLNPRPREQWRQDDCIMDVYAPYCTGVFECRNAVQLGRVIKAIM